MGLKESLGKQIGPLPMGAWIIVVGAGIGIAYYTKKKNVAPAVVDDTSVPAGVANGSVGGFSQTYPTGTQGTDTSSQTNEGWAHDAIAYLIGQGYDPGLSDQAIRQYLAGDTPSVQGQALINIALKKLGPPPTAIPAATVPPIPVPTPTPTPGGTTAPAVLPPPTGLKVVKIFVHQVMIGFKWVPGAVGYQIQSTSPWTPIYFFPASPSNGRPAGENIGPYPLFTRTTYHFHIRSVNSAGVAGAWSSVIAATPH